MYYLVSAVAHMEWHMASTMANGLVVANEGQQHPPTTPTAKDTSPLTTKSPESTQQFMNIVGSRAHVLINTCGQAWASPKTKEHCLFGVCLFGVCGLHGQMIAPFNSVEALITKQKNLVSLGWLASMAKSLHLSILKPS